MARLAACICVVALVVLSWLPKEMEARTGLPGQLEHMAAYAGTALFIALGFDRRARLLTGLIALAGMLEIGQIWIPGRTSQVIDFVASSAGAVIGMAVGYGLMRLQSSRRA